ncbi:MAG: stalk domain-containing protein, partial [Eubacteriales bacterium]
MKRFICGFLAGALVFGTVGAFAASYIANPAGFKVLVNGKEFVSDPPALVVEGRTYLPLRAMGDVLGVPVNWNEELRQAEVGEEPKAANIDNVVKTN